MDEIKYKIITGRLNRYKFGQIVTKLTCPPIRALVEQGEAVRVSTRTRRFAVGVKTKELICGWRDVASDRLRAEWIIEQNSDFELYRDDTDYRVVVFHHPDPAGLYDIKSKKVLDICDKTWDEDRSVLPFAQEMDAVVVASPGLKKALSERLDRPIAVIGDGHKLTERIYKLHRGEAKTVIWFGYSANAHVLKPYLEFLKKNQLCLRAVAERKNEVLDSADEFIEWDYHRCQEEIFNSDIALLPKNGEYKTNNKDVTAWLCGVPVAKSEKDVLKLLDARERNAQVKKVDFSKYDIIKRAAEYQKLCAGL